MILTTGTTDVTLDVQIVDDDGLPVTGLVAATWPTVYISRGTGADIAVSLSDLALLTSAHADGGVKERGGGYYRFDPPDTLAAVAAARVTLRGEATGKRLIAPTIQVGGSGIVLPAAALVPRTPVGSLIQVFTAQTVVVAVTLRDDAGDLVDLSSYTLTWQAWDATRTVVVGPVSATGEVFGFSVTIATTTVLDQIMTGQWSVREDGGSEAVLAHGPFAILARP